MLDTHPVGGSLTTLDALAASTPVVTLPGATLNGRFSQGYYARMAEPALTRACVARGADEAAAGEAFVQVGGSLPAL